MAETLHSLHTSTKTYIFENEGRYSFLVIAEPLTPFIYKRNGKGAESIMTETFDGKGNRITHMTGDRSKIQPNNFLEQFVYVEFYFDQLLKLCLIDSFSIEQWGKLEYVIEAMSMRSKMEIVKKLDMELWNAIKLRLSDLQALRNAMAHSPVGPYKYLGREVDWDIIDHDMARLTINLLTEYKKRQNPILNFVEAIRLDFNK